MTIPLVYVDMSDVREGALPELQAAIAELSAFIEANEPRLLAYSAYFSDDGRQMHVVHVHRDAASLDFHMEVAGPRFARFAELLQLRSITVYGTPTRAGLAALEEKARLLGGTVTVAPPHAGFVRAPATANNLELHRRLYESFNARDIDGLLALCDPSVTVKSVFAAVGGEVYHGHDGVRRWQTDLEEAWGSEIRVEVEAYFELGERTLAFDVLHGRGRESDAKVALPGAGLARWHDRRCLSFTAYADRDEPLRELGLSREALA